MRVCARAFAVSSAWCCCGGGHGLVMCFGLRDRDLPGGSKWPKVGTLYRL